MTREYGDFIKDILNAIRETSLFTECRSFDTFAANAKQGSLGKGVPASTFVMKKQSPS